MLKLESSLRFPKFLMYLDIGGIPRVANGDNDFFPARSSSYSFVSRVLFSSSKEASGQLPHPGRRDRWLQRATVIAEIVWLTKMSLGFHYFQPPWGTTAQRVYATLSLVTLPFPRFSRFPRLSSRRDLANPVVFLVHLSHEIQHEVGQLRSRLLGNCHKGSTGLTSSAIDICRGNRNWFLEMHDCVRLGWFRKVMEISGRSSRTERITRPDLVLCRSSLRLFWT